MRARLIEGDGWLGSRAQVVGDVEWMSRLRRHPPMTISCISCKQTLKKINEDTIPFVRKSQAIQVDLLFRMLALVRECRC
jgi:hypothetical protein